MTLKRRRIRKIRKQEMFEIFDGIAKNARRSVSPLVAQRGSAARQKGRRAGKWSAKRAAARTG